MDRGDQVEMKSRVEMGVQANKQKKRGRKPQEFSMGSLEHEEEPRLNALPIVEGRVDLARLGPFRLDDGETQLPDDLADDSLSLYFREITRIPLLKAEEEVSLARSIEAGKRAAKQLGQGHLDRVERTRLEQQVVEGEQARHRLIRSNSRLVVSIARRYMGQGLSLLDLIQEGNIGLIHAVEKFDYKRGFKFSTYATWWIRQGVTRALANQGWTIRLPVHMWDKVNRMTRASRRLVQELGREPTKEELAADLEITPERLDRLHSLAQRPISLETPVGQDQDAELQDWIPDETTPEPVDVVTQHALREQLGELLDTLSPREARILRLRFGLEDGTAYTLEEIGRKFGYTRERIRQLEQKGLRKLRHPSRRRKLSGFAPVQSTEML